jgi:hypothetical protein
MRTTLTLDDDIAAKLKAEARRTGRPFRELVNESLRRGLLGKRSTEAPIDFRVEARDLGNLRLGLSIDNVAELIEQVEGPLHR